MDPGWWNKEVRSSIPEKSDPGPGARLQTPEVHHPAAFGLLGRKLRFSRPRVYRMAPHRRRADWRSEFVSSMKSPGNTSVFPAKRRRGLSITSPSSLRRSASLSVSGKRAMIGLVRLQFRSTSPEASSLHRQRKCRRRRCLAALQAQDHRRRQALSVRTGFSPPGDS